MIILMDDNALIRWPCLGALHAMAGYRGESMCLVAQCLSQGRRLGEL